MTAKSNKATMSRQAMYLRMITASFARRKSRMLVALLAIAVGATILSGLVTIYYDVPRQMGAQFRNYGANMIFLASSNDASFDMDTVETALDCIDSGELVGYLPQKFGYYRDDSPTQFLTYMAALNGVVLFHEVLSVWVVLGIVCVLGGVVLLAGDTEKGTGKHGEA